MAYVDRNSPHARTALGDAEPASTDAARAALRASLAGFAVATALEPLEASGHAALVGDAALDALSVADVEARAVRPRRTSAATTAAMTSANATLPPTAP